MRARNSSGGSRKSTAGVREVHRDDQERRELAGDLRGLLAPDRRSAADRQEQDVDLADRSSLLAAQGRLAEVAHVADPHPSSEKTKIVFGPRRVPAKSSCSDATATISPSGDSKVPAVERRTRGDPETDSTPLWSACSWVTRTRSAGTPEIRG
jgi:hypothetical protein